MAQKDRDETLTVTRGQLDEMIATAVASSVKAAAEAATEIAVKHTRGNAGIESTHATEEQRIHAMLGTPIPARECIKTMHIPCRNPRNGAEFLAVVTPSNKWPEGRVVDLIEYRYPADLAKRSGKLVHPTGKHGGSKSDVTYPLVGGGGLQGPFLPEFLQWVWEEYGQMDRRMYVGQSAGLLPACGEPVEWKPESTARTLGDARVA